INQRDHHNVLASGRRGFEAIRELFGVARVVVNGPSNFTQDAFAATLAQLLSVSGTGIDSNRLLGEAMSFEVGHGRVTLSLVVDYPCHIVTANPGFLLAGKLPPGFAQSSPPSTTTLSIGARDQRTFQAA